MVSKVVVVRAVDQCRLVSLAALSTAETEIKASII